MKNLVKFLCIAWLCVLAACSGSSAYSPEKCEALVEKIKSNDQLTEGDLEQMIDQFGAIVTWMADEKKKAGGDEGAFKEALSAPEARTKAEYMVYFGLELDRNRDKLSASNVANLAKYMKEMKEIKE